MRIYYENGCFSLWSIDALDEMPKTAARKVARMIGKNLDNPENEDCIVTFCEWICDKITFFQRKFTADRKDKDTEKRLKFYISLSNAAGF